MMLMRFVLDSNHGRLHFPEFTLIQQFGIGFMPIVREGRIFYPRPTKFRLPVELGALHETVVRSAPFAYIIDEIPSFIVVLQGLNATFKEVELRK